MVEVPIKEVKVVGNNEDEEDFERDTSLVLCSGLVYWEFRVGVDFTFIIESS